MPTSKDMARLEAKVDKQGETLTNIDKTMVRQQAILDEHVRRSDLLEQHLDLHRSEVEQHMEAMRVEVQQHLELLKAEVKPISTHVAVIGGIAKIVTLAGVLVGIATGVAKLAGWLS